MRRVILFLILLTSIGGCSRTIQPDAVPPVGDITETAPEPLLCSGEESEHRTTADRRVSFENVSFSVDSSWVRNVEYFVTPECVLVVDEIKPDPVGARTLNFNLRYSASDEEAYISTFPIEDYRNAFARFPHYLENREADLRAIIERPASIRSYGVEAPPHVRWMDGSPTFYAKAVKRDFANGSGLFVVTHISQDAFITISNWQLSFLFQGFTRDGKYFVEMHFPVKLKGLADEPDEFFARSKKGKGEYGSSEHLAAYNDYILRTAARIDKAYGGDFQPSIHQIERFIKGFGVR